MADVVQHAKIATLLLPGIGTTHDVKAAYDAGARVVRIATHCTEADISKQHIEYARELGMAPPGSACRFKQFGAGRRSSATD